MTSMTFLLIFVPILAIVFLAINLLFAPHSPYQEKDSVFECGFHSFLGQNRTQFSISFFIFALLFLLFDLEILLIYPYAVSAYTNDIYGLVIMLIFFLALTLGFAFELGKNALKIDSKQTILLTSKQSSLTACLNSFSLFTSITLGLSIDKIRSFSTTAACLINSDDDNSTTPSRPSSVERNSQSAAENAENCQQMLDDFREDANIIRRGLAE
jgi:NADH-ubiquinone oxidoreductase chain 3